MPQTKASSVLSPSTVAEDDDQYSSDDATIASVIPEPEEPKSFVSIHLKQLELVRKLGADARRIMNEMTAKHQENDALEIAKLDELNQSLFRDTEKTKLMLDVIATTVNVVERERLKKMLQAEMARTEQRINHDLASVRLSLAGELYERQTQRDRDAYQTLARGYSVVSDFGSYISHSGRSALMYNRGALMVRLEESSGPQQGTGTTQAAQTDLQIYLNRNDRTRNIRVGMDHLSLTYRILDGAAGWGVVRATDGPWLLRDTSKSVVLDLIKQLVPLRPAKTPQPIHRAIARALDVAHPGSRLYSEVVARPHLAARLIQDRIDTLQYPVDQTIAPSLPATRDADLPRMAESILRSLGQRMSRYGLYYMEAEVSNMPGTGWCVGMVRDGSVVAEHPGMSRDGFALLHTGAVVHDSVSMPYASGHLLKSARTIGMLVDQAAETLSFFADSVPLGVAFGEGSLAWSEQASAAQSSTIGTVHLVPVVGLYLDPTHPDPTPPHMAVNFGSRPFLSSPDTHPIPFDITCDSEAMSLFLSQTTRTPTVDLGPIANMDKQKFIQELQYPRPTSWSKYPPDQHQATIAAMTLQRAYRRRLLIVHVSRRIEAKHDAQRTIVRHWRRFIQRRNRAATIVQSIYRAHRAREYVAERAALAMKFGGIVRMARAVMVIGQAHQYHSGRGVRTALKVEYGVGAHRLYYSVYRIGWAWRRFVARQGG